MAISPQDTDTTVNATRARQGRWGRPVLMVLLIGTLLAAIAMFAALFFRAGIEGEPGTGQERVVAPVTMDTPAPRPATPQTP